MKWLGMDVAPEDWPAGVDRASAQRALWTTMLQALRPLSGLVGVLYLGIGVFHVFLHPAPLSLVMGLLSLVNGSALLGTHLALKRERIPPERVGLLLFLLAVLTTLQNLVHSTLNPQPALVGVLAMIILVVSIVLPSTRLLLLFDSFAVLGFAAASMYVRHEGPILVEILLIAVVLPTGLLLHVFFQTLLFRLHAHRLEDRSRTAALETTVSALEAVRNKYELLAQNVSDVIWIRDLEFNPIYVSPSVLHLRGYSAPEVMTQAPDQVLSPESLERAREWIMARLALEPQGRENTDAGQVLPLQEPHRDGHMVWTEARVRFLRDADGTPVGLVGSTRDVTERHEAEERLALVLDELKRSNQELEQFAYIASHDLKEPLRVVASQLHLLERRAGENLSQRGKRYLSHAVEGAVRMQELIDGLLSYSRFGAGSVDPRPVDLDSVLAEVRQSLEVALTEAKVALLAEPLPLVHGDRKKLTHLLQNLIQNAIKFRGDRAPEIRVGLDSQGDDHAVVFVKDNGIGIDPKHHERIFRLFERLHTREEYDGTGIGLALCKRIVDQHGGKLWLESTPGEGTTFFCRLPTLGPRSQGSAPLLEEERRDHT